MYRRNDTRTIVVRGILIGGGNPVTVQSMTNTQTTDVSATINQIRALVSAGCDIVRVAVPTPEAVEAFKEIRSAVDVPLVADIHFDYRLALRSLEAGADKLRINPGNIGGSARIRDVVSAATELGIPIRIGVNAGSLKKEILERHGGPTPEALVESALEEVDILDDLGFHDVCVSIKSSSVPATITAYRLFAEQRDHPLHVGVTEAGTLRYGTIKSSCGIGGVLSGGIGDTIRVSLTADPVNEVVAGISILKAMGLRKAGAEVISCPTCGRTEIDIIGLAEEVERRASSIASPIIIAVMGCVVNGPGEAREADYGIAGGKGTGLLFRKGEKVRTVPERELVDALFALIDADNPR
ncbi:flavodoxin-dependent (E)-4-hydroxy-3-methylbut-2-enyl-diphosphate synthase [bacterium]|nr:flavodoxin-dependent (E)-4-hydroxy-3-methylbut-2-enyl-diphosphate synthase [bacterium]